MAGMLKSASRYALKRRRTSSVLLALLVFLAAQFIGRVSSSDRIPPATEQTDVLAETIDSTDLESAAAALETLAVKGRAPSTGYSRSNFSDGWARIGSCDVRNLILARDLSQTELEDGCTVLAGVLIDPYTDKEIIFVRGADTSDEVQIDHVVALSDSWQKGAQALSADERFQLYNDGLNLLAVDGDANQSKSGSDAASWLPENKAYRCRFAARQIAVKQKYRLWVTQAEKDALKRVLSSCPDQPLPVQEKDTTVGDSGQDGGAP